MYATVLLLHRGTREEGPFVYRPYGDVPEVWAADEASIEQAVRDWGLTDGIVLPDKVHTEACDGDFWMVFLLDEKQGDITGWRAADADRRELKRVKRLIGLLSE